MRHPHEDSPGDMDDRAADADRSIRERSMCWDNSDALEAKRREETARLEAMEDDE